MNERHLTRNDLQKYMDTSDLSEAYLLWMEQVTEHLLECPKCQAALQKLMLIDSICEEESCAEALELATQEEAVRRDLLIAKLQQMQEQARMAEVIQKLSEQAVSPIMLQMSDLQRRAGVVRGDAEQHRMQLPKGAEVTAQDGKVVVKVTKQDSEEAVTVLLDRKGLEPSVCEAVWNESEQCYVAEFMVSDSQEEFELYIIR